MSNIIIDLMIRIKDDELLIEMISETFKACSRYVDLINQQEVLVTIEKYNMTKDQRLERMIYLDTQRNSTHNVIISGIKNINRLCLAFELEKFYKGDENDRVEIAEFAMNLVDKSFKNRKL